MSVLRKVKVSWAKVLAPDTRFTPQWVIDVHLEKEHIDQLNKEAQEINPKFKVKLKTEDDGSKSIKLKRFVTKADGGANNPPLVCGPKGKDDPWDKLIGNGSVCNVQYTLVPYDNKFGKGVTNDLKGVQVLEHVSFAVQDGDEFDSEDTGSSKDPDEFNDDDFDN